MPVLPGVKQYFAPRKPALPYDAEVEYLEAPGDSEGNSLGAYIDLGVNSTADNFCNFDIRFRNLKSTMTHPPFGYQYGASARYGMWGTLRNIGADSSYAATGYAYDTDWHSVFLRNGEYVEYDGSRATVGTGTVRGNISLILFGIVMSSTGNSQRTLVWARIAAFRLYNLVGDLLRDLIPVRFTNELGQIEGAMYDRANPTVGMNPDGSPRADGLYRNRGTGAFTIGPDKVDRDS